MKHVFILSTFVLLASTGLAAPPQDLSVFRGRTNEASKPLRPTRPVRIGEDVITAGDLPPPGAPQLRRTLSRVVRYDVVCRAAPGRKGKAKVKLSAKSKVVEKQRAAAWRQVVFAPKQPPCWVPASALR